MQQWHEEQSNETAATSRKHEGLQQDREVGFQSGSHEASGWDFQWVTGSEWLWIVEKLTPIKTKEETSKAQPEIEDDDGTPRPNCTLSGSHSGLAALRREQRE
jgi:hypothetical protein